MDDIVWIPVSKEEKERLEKICALNGMTVREWFINALQEAEEKNNK